MKKILAFMLTFAIFSIINAEEIHGKVVAVTDGDTVIVFTAANKKRHRIRLHKIDAPEYKQAFGQKSKQYLSSLIYGKQVTVKYTQKDQYGRILGVIYCNNVDINLQMVQAGMAWHYSYYDKTPSYIEAEQKARAAKKGLWIDPDPINPYQFRKSKRNRKKR